MTISDEREREYRFATRRFGGTGLGLAICKNLVNRIGFRSRDGGGSIFHFKLEMGAATKIGADNAAVEAGGPRTPIIALTAGVAETGSRAPGAGHCLYIQSRCPV